MTITFEQTQDTTRGHNFMLRGIFQNSSAPQDNHGNIQIRTVSYNTTNPQDPQGDGAPSDFSHTAWVFAGHPVNSTPIAPNNTASTILHAYTIAKAGNQYIKSDDGFSFTGSACKELNNEERSVTKTFCKRLSLRHHLYTISYAEKWL